MIQKNCFLLIERYKPFQNFGKKYFFLSDCILSSKWPGFAVPIHSGNAVKFESSSIVFIPEFTVNDLELVSSNVDLANARCLVSFSLSKGGALILIM